MSLAPKATSTHRASTPARRTSSPASAPTNPSHSTAIKAAKIIPAICAASAFATRTPARTLSSSPTSSPCPPRPFAPSTRAAGKSNYSSSGSSSTCESRHSTEPAKTRSKRNSGSPSRSTCWSPSSKNASNSPAHSTLCCKSFQLLCSRKCPFHRHFSRRTTQIHS